MWLDMYVWTYLPKNVQWCRIWGCFIMAHAMPRAGPEGYPLQM